MFYFVIAQYCDIHNTDKIIGYKVCELDLTVYDVKSILTNSNYINLSVKLSDLSFYAYPVIVKLDVSKLNKKNIISELIKVGDKGILEKADLRCEFLLKDINTSQLPCIIYDTLNSRECGLRKNSKKYIALFKNNFKGTYMLVNYECKILVNSKEQFKSKLKLKDCTNAHLTNNEKSIWNNDILDISEKIEDYENNWKTNFDTYVSNNYEKINSLADDNYDLFNIISQKKNKENKEDKEDKEHEENKDLNLSFPEYVKYITSILQNLYSYLDLQDLSLKATKFNDFCKLVKPLLIVPSIGTKPHNLIIKGLSSGISAIEYIGNSKLLNENAKIILSIYSENIHFLILRYIMDKITIRQKLKSLVPVNFNVETLVRRHSYFELLPLELLYVKNKLFKDNMHLYIKTQNKNELKMDNYDIFLCEQASQNNFTYINEDAFKYIESAYFSSWFYLFDTSMVKERLKKENTNTCVNITNNYTIISDNPWSVNVKKIYNIWGIHIFQKLILEAFLFYDSKNLTLQDNLLSVLGNYNTYVELFNTVFVKYNNIDIDAIIEVSFEDKYVCILESKKCIIPISKLKKDKVGGKKE